MIAVLKRLPAAQIEESGSEQDEVEDLNPVALQIKSMWHIFVNF